MSAIRFRPVQPKDNVALAVAIRTVLVEMGAPKVGTAYADTTLDHMYEAYNVPRSAYFVVEKEGTILGGAGIAPLQGGPEYICEFQKMYFLPEARGTGIARKLLAHCMDLALSWGFTQSYIETLPSMLVAQKLYKNFGFTYLEGPMGSTGHTSCSVWMLKHLTE